MNTDFTSHPLDEKHVLWSRMLPEELRLSEQQFEEMWALHPEDYLEITIHSRKVKTPRWQQAYGADYHYTGQVNRALPVHPLMQPLLEWCQWEIDGRINGILLNWYDGELEHYIGKHRDSTKNMFEGAPIVTISFGEQRKFRMRPWKQQGFEDFNAIDSSVFVIPYDTNLAWTHEVPKSKAQRGRRISLTFRGFRSTTYPT